MNAILSIKPIYAHAILNRKKKVEFRKQSFKRDIEKVYIYSSAPDQKILGYFTIQEIVSDTPQSLWKKFGHVGSIDKDSFFQYYNNHRIGYSYVIQKSVRFRIPIDPRLKFDKFVAPQSFLYCERDL